MHLYKETFITITVLKMSLYKEDISGWKIMTVLWGK